MIRLHTAQPGPGRHERRKVPRVPGTSMPADIHVRLRAGHDAAVIDWSSFGILLESPSRLLPGHRCTVRVVAEMGRFAHPGRVLRAWVVKLDRKQGVTYRGAIEFEHPADLCWVAASLVGSSYS